MATVQLKTFYEKKLFRCKIYRTSNTWLEFATYEDFASTKLEAIGIFFLEEGGNVLSEKLNCFGGRTHRRLD